MNGSSGFSAMLLAFPFLFLMLGRVAPLRAETTPASLPAPQTTAEPNETFFAAPTRVRLIAGPWTRLTLLGGSEFAVIPGGGGGFLLYDRLLLMAYACSLGARTAPDDDTRKFSLSGLGGQIAWVFAPSKRVHGNVAALLGNTSANVTAKADANDTATLEYLSIEPYAEVEASLYFGLKVFAGGGYRILAGGANQAGIDSRYLRGPTLEFGFRMGS
jgi:hypothetical protein